MKIVICCSDLGYRGGMVSVVKGYLNYPAKGDVEMIFVPTHCEGGRLRRTLQFAKAWAKIAGLTLKGDIAAAHLHVSERGSFIRKGLLLKLFQARHIPVVLHHHGAEFDSYYNSSSPRHQRFIRETLRRADVNIVLSRRLIDMVKSKAPAARVEVLYNAVEAAPENPYSTAARNILFLGRLGRRKGVYDLIEAVERLDGELPGDVKLLLCGDGETAEIEQLVARRGLTHRVAHIGWVDGEQKEALIRSAMVNILPSYNEGLPMTILETMARGIPNISTRIASIPEVITHGKTGFLIEPGDIDSLVAAIRRIVADEPLRRALSEASHSLIRSQFSIDRAFRRLKEIFRSII